MTATETLELLLDRQDEIRDTCRLFRDGSIREATTTFSGQKGWSMLAAPVTGAVRMFHGFFARAEIEFVKVQGLREALWARDLMLAECAVLTMPETDARNHQPVSPEESAGRLPVLL